jgi:hypothetical protein
VTALLCRRHREVLLDLIDGKVTSMKMMTRAATYLGLVSAGPGPRGKWARITSAGRDSSRAEAAAGILVSLILVVVVASTIFERSPWLKIPGAVATVILLGGFVRAIVMYAATRRTD